MPQCPLQDDGRLHGVIIGCQNQAGCWLMIRRSEHVVAPLKLCFPGGAVEVGEAYEAAGEREMLEELGVAVRLIRHVWTHAIEDRPVTLFGYLGELTSETLTPNAHEVAETLWLTPDQIATHPDTLPHTEDFVAALRAAAPGCR